MYLSLTLCLKASNTEQLAAVAGRLGTDFLSCRLKIEFILLAEVKLDTFSSSPSARSNYWLICRCVFSHSPSPGTCAQPAGRLQLANVGVSELGQTADGQRGAPHLQTVLHRQKRRKRAGTIPFSFPFPRFAVSSVCLFLNERFRCFAAHEGNPRVEDKKGFKGKTRLKLQVKLD